MTTPDVERLAADLLTMSFHFRNPQHYLGHTTQWEQFATTCHDAALALSFARAAGKRDAARIARAWGDLDQTGLCGENWEHFRYARGQIADEIERSITNAEI